MIKEKKHPYGMIDMTIVPFSAVVSNHVKIMYDIPINHHVLIIDMGEEE